MFIFEEYNNRMAEMLEAYGNRFVVEDDVLCAKKYLSVLDDTMVFSELKNRLRLMYLEECEIIDDVQ